jgi:hypothetical protein
MRFWSMKGQDSIEHLENEIETRGAAAKIDLLMSTLTATGVPASRRSTGLRIFLWLLLIVILLASGVIAYAYFIARAALPQLDGSIKANGLAAAVKVTRDSHGVPAIEAATLDDLFFAQGYVTAQDRLWQMDIMRVSGAENSPKF